jgi:hypothetical protein
MNFMKMLICIISAALLLIGCGHNRELVDLDKSIIQQQITNVVVGYYRTVNIDVHHNAPNPQLWTAYAIVEHFNTSGGIERETVPFECLGTNLWVVNEERWHPLK